MDEDGWGVRMRVLPYDVAEGPEDASTGNLASVQLQLRWVVQGSQSPNHAMPP